VTGGKMKKLNKTNAMRILESMDISYDYLTYECEDGKVDGISVAHKTGQDPEEVFKTLVAVGHSKELYVFCIPVEYELDLKKAAKASEEKNIEMLPLKELTKNTGYIRGGCSPIGMKKHYKTFIDESAMLHSRIVVSGGLIGLQLILNPNDLLRGAEASFADLI
jgi:Cys-tRNA(Pro)/Cys-tRNA(Cys) deacylase